MNWFSASRRHAIVVRLLPEATNSYQINSCLFNIQADYRPNGFLEARGDSKRGKSGGRDRQDREKVGSYPDDDPLLGQLMEQTIIDFWVVLAFPTTSGMSLGAGAEDVENEFN